MDDKTQAFLDSIGAIAEMSGVMFKEFLKNGFDRKEALDLTKSYVHMIFGMVTPDNKDNKEEK